MVNNRGIIHSLLFLPDSFCDSSTQLCIGEICQAILGRGCSKTCILADLLNEFLGKDSTFDLLLLDLSDLYDSIRAIVSKKESSRLLWTPPDSFSRKTIKFWVEPGELLNVKVHLLKYQPILIVGQEKLRPVADGAFMGWKPDLHETRQTHISPSTMVTSVYFDNSETLNTYHARLSRKEGATLFRMRWYGCESLNTNPAIGTSLFLEQKVHHKAKPSIKTRVPFPPEIWQMPFTTALAIPWHQFQSVGTYVNDNKKEDLCKMQHGIDEGHEVPMIRTCYRRTAFQSQASNKIRFTLDESIVMTRECGESNSSANAEYFPYAVLEVKLESHGDEDADLQQLCDLLPMNHLLKVPKFSKFLHGTAALLTLNIDRVPHWFVKEPTSHSAQNYRPYTYQEMASLVLPDPIPCKNSHCSDTRLCKHEMDIQSGDMDSKSDGQSDNFVPGATTLYKGTPGKSVFTTTWRRYVNRMKDSILSSDIQSRGNVIPNKKAGPKAREPPRTFFSNERTFLSWLSIAVLLLFAGLSLMDGANFSTLSNLAPASQATALGIPTEGVEIASNQDPRFVSHKVTGIVIVPVSLVFMIYALAQYRNRAEKLLKREDIRYDDQIGPIMLVTFLLLASIAAFTLSLHSMSLV